MVSLMADRLRSPCSRAYTHWGLHTLCSSSRAHLCLLHPHQPQITQSTSVVNSVNLGLKKLVLFLIAVRMLSKGPAFSKFLLAFSLEPPQNQKYPEKYQLKKEDM